MKLLFIYLFVVSLSSFQCRIINFDKDNIRVTIDQGSLIGLQTKDFYNDTYYSFKAIPYAKPPVGELRFKAPESPEPWLGVYNATISRPACPQAPFMGSNPLYSEDCLFLNVHTKMADKLKPVLVYIHGGAFEFGSISMPDRGSQWLMAEDIVFVEIQYRLSFFGFLSFDDPKYDIRGNAGLKDQVMALKWIQKNIKQFGGDPNQVTIFGESAGGASVHLLYVSPLAKGLFHRAIAQSGSGANTWVQSLNKYPQVAEALNCSSVNVDEIVKCINGSSTDELLSITQTLKKNPNNSIVDDISISVLTIEDRNSKDPFITDTVENIITKGEFSKVPIIMGICANESVPFVSESKLPLNFTEADYESLIPKDMNVNKGSPEAFNIGKQIKEFYYGNQTPSENLIDPYIRYLSDIKFVQKINYIAKLQVSIAPEVPVYFYKFNYLTKLNFLGYPHLDNYVYHADDLPYLFFNDQKQVNELSDPNSNEFIGMRRMIKLWTTFAKSENGNPNPINDPLFENVTWKSMDSNNFYYLHINPNLELQKNVYEDQMTFWDKLYRKYGQI